MKLFVGMSQAKRPVVRQLRWEDNIRMDLTEIASERTDRVRFRMQISDVFV